MRNLPECNRGKLTKFYNLILRFCLEIFALFFFIIRRDLTASPDV